MLALYFTRYPPNFYSVRNTMLHHQIMSTKFFTFAPKSYPASAHMELLVLIVSSAIFSVLNISLMPLRIGPPTRKKRSGNCTSRRDYSSGAAPLRNLHIYKHHFHRTITMDALYMLRTTAPIHNGRCKRLFSVHSIWKKMFLQTSTKKRVGTGGWHV